MNTTGTAPSTDARRSDAAGVVVHAPSTAASDEVLRVRLTWLLVFRFAVITVLLTSALLLRLGTNEALFGRALIVIYATAALAYISILGGALFIRRFGSRGVRPLAYAQLAFDSIIASLLVFGTGGVESLFVFVYSLTVLNAGAVLQRRGAVSLAAISAILYTVVLVLEVTGALLPFGLEQPPSLTSVLSPFVTNISSFFLVAFLAGYLTEQLRRTSESLNEAHAQLERLEELYGAVLESLPSGVLTVDEGGLIVYVNSSGADILGLRVDELVGKRITEVAPAIPVNEGLQQHERFDRMLDNRGERFIGGSIARLTGIEGLAGRVVVFQDLTELRRLQHDVARSERLAELGRFAAGLAHEIRNPLAAMIGCLQLLENDALAQRPLGEEGSRMVTIVGREAERLSHLVTEFLLYARPAPPRIHPTSLLGLVHETVAAAAQGLDASVHIDVVVESSPTVLCDAGQMRQVLWNLVGNAIHAVKGAEGQTRGASRVQIVVGEVGDLARFCVDDDGPGVSAELRGRIFEPFFTTRANGTGLGLATSHQILAVQGATISVGTAPLGGARFEVRMPRSTVMLPVPVEASGAMAALPASLG